MATVRVTSGASWRRMRELRAGMEAGFQLSVRAVYLSLFILSFSVAAAADLPPSLPAGVFCPGAATDMTSAYRVSEPKFLE